MGGDNYTNMLTTSNYFDFNNGVLTRSKICDYRLDPNYFYRKHIKGEIEKEEKDAFKVGGAVDNLLAQIDNLPKYKVFEGDRRTKQGKEDYNNLIEEGAVIVNQKQYDQIIYIADAVIRTSAYKHIKNWEKQKVLELKQQVGDYFTSIAGLPDFFNKDREVIDIVDLKTSRTVEDFKYHFHCIEYNYYVQAALYCWLAKQFFPEVTEVNFYHLVVEKQEPYRVKVFKLSQSRIAIEETKLLNTIYDLSQDKKFAKSDADFISCPTIGDPNPDSIAELFESDSKSIGNGYVSDGDSVDNS